MSGFPSRPAVDLPVAVRENAWLIATCVVAALGLAGWLGMRKTPEYTATAVLRSVEGTAVDLPSPTDHAILARVVEREGLRLFSPATSEPAGFIEGARIYLPPERSGTIHLDFLDHGVAYGPSDGRRTAAYGERVVLDGADFVVPSRPRAPAVTLQVVSRNSAIELLRERVVAAVDVATGSLRIAYRAFDPRVAPRVVNAIAAEYQTASAENVRRGMRERRESLEVDLGVADSMLATAEVELALIRIREESDRSRSELEAELRTLESLLERVLRARSSGRARELPNPASLSGVARDPVVGPLYARLHAYRVERDGLLVGPQALVPEHPDVQRLSILIASTEQDVIEAIGARIGGLRRRIEVLGADRVPDTGGGGVELTRDIGELQRTTGELRARYLEARLNEGTESGPVEIVELSGPARRLPRNLVIELSLGLVLGLLLGGAAALVREGLGRLKRRIRPGGKAAREAVQDIPEAPTLVVIPEVTPSLVEPGINHDSGLEAYRSLRSTLLSSRWGLKTLVVTSAHPGEGKTTTSTNLAATYARQGQKVVLVECDLRRPSLGRYFGIKKETDLMDVLFEDHDWRRAIQLTNMPGLYVILGEKSFPKAGDSLGGPEMIRLLAELSSEYDLVILDTSPLLVAADATALGPIVDGVLIVVRAARADEATQREVVRKLTQVGASVIGTVLNDPEGVIS